MVRDNGSDNNVRISGEGRVQGGTYGAVTINGAGSVKGDIVCATFRVNGAANADGSVRADQLIVNGTVSLGGELQAASMNVNGDASITLGAGVGQLKVKGRCYVGGGVAAHDVEVKGELTVAGDLEADSFRSEGAFSVGGLLNAGEIDIRLYGSGKAREIGGERIVVRQATGLASIFNFLGEKRLSADLIEGDAVDVQYTTAKTVRGARVEIGEGCIVDLVEYTDQFTQGAGAVVRTATKVAAAADLTSE